MSFLSNKRGVSLIVVIFIIMLLGGLGWSMAVMLTGDFDMNLRMFNGEKALYTAQSGVYWALAQLNANGTWRTDTDNDGCADTTDWMTHTLGRAQYRVCCRDANATEQSIGDVCVVSQGYVPSYAAYQASRQLNVLVRSGEFSKAVQARGVFDWSGADKSESYVDGDTQVLYYDGDGDAAYNEVGSDYRSGSSPLPPIAWPWGSGTRTVGADPYPQIDMPEYEQNNDHTWSAPLTAKITAVATVDSGTRTQLTIDTNIVSGSGWTGQLARNISRGHCAAGTWKPINAVNVGAAVTIKLDGLVDWQTGERICLAVKPLPQSGSPKGIVYNSSAKTYTVTFPVDVFTGDSDSYQYQVLRRLVYKKDANPETAAGWDNREWGVIVTVNNARSAVIYMDQDYAGSSDALRWDTLWNAGNPCWFSIAKRFRGDVKNQGLWYVRNDVLLDVRDRQEDWENKKIDETVYFNKSGLVCEGDAVVKGPKELHFSKKPLEFPNLATKNGHIICLDEPDGWTWIGKLTNRNFDDFAYSENGDVWFNYIDSKGVYGQNVTLTGVFHISYDSSAVRRMSGYSFSLGGYKWKEQ